MADVVAQIRKAVADRDPGALLAAIPYASYFDFGAEIDDGDLLLIMPAQERVIGNPILPALHGGAVGALLESSAILKLLWDTEPERLPKTINITVDYLRSGRMLDTRARASITKHGRRVATVRVHAYQDDESKPIAVAHAHFLLGSAPG